MSEIRRLRPEDVFSFVHAAETKIAPIGGRIAAIMVRRDRATDRRVAHVALFDGAWHDLPGTTGATALAWSPDSTRLAILARDADASTLTVHGPAGAATLVTGSKLLRELAWSPDGTTIAFQRQEPVAAHEWLTLPAAPEGSQWAPPPTITDRLAWRHDTVGLLPEAVWQTCVVPAAGGAARQITEGPWFSGFYFPPGLGWTPDGTALILAASRRADWDRAMSDIHIQQIDVATSAVHPLTHEPGAQANPAVSPDGRFLAYTAVIERKISGQLRRVFLCDMDSGATRELLPDFDRGIDSLAWTADSTALILASDGPGYRGLLRAGLDGSVTELMQNLGSGGIEMPYQGGGFSLARDGSLAYIRAGIDTPGDIARRGPNGDETVLTALNAELAAEIGGFRPAERLSVPASSDGAPIDAWLILPPGTPPEAGWPVVLEIHGGPYAAYGERFSIKHQTLAANGYAVLFANPRGSVGYGEAFAAALHNRFPGPDHSDLMDVMDSVIARPDIDATHQYITGVSGGGTLTLWAIGHTSRFRAAISIKPVVSWESWMLTADLGPFVGRTWLGQETPWSAPAHFRALSPLAHLPGATTPTLIMAGETDVRTPISEAEQAYACLKMQGTTAALMRFPGASHSSAAMRPSHVAAEVAASLAWFARFAA